MILTYDQLKLNYIQEKQLICSQLYPYNVDCAYERGTTQLSSTVCAQQNSNTCLDILQETSDKVLSDGFAQFRQNKAINRGKRRFIDPCFAPKITFFFFRRYTQRKIRLQPRGILRVAASYKFAVCFMQYYTLRQFCRCLHRTKSIVFNFLYSDNGKTWWFRFDFFVLAILNTLLSLIRNLEEDQLVNTILNNIY